MKKIIIIFLLLIMTNNVYAQNNEITKEDINIKYKWYKEEVVDSLFYRKGDYLEGYLEKDTYTKDGNYSKWNTSFCSYSKKNYIIESRIVHTYTLLEATRYIKFINLYKEDIDRIHIYSERNIVNFNLKEETQDGIIIELEESKTTSILWFYIDLEKDYSMELSYFSDFSSITLSKNISNTKLLLPDSTWINSKTHFLTIITTNTITTNDFIKETSRKTECRVKSIETYRYKVEKKYYDDNYYEYLEGYIPDISDYIVEYKGELPTNKIEIEKKVENVIKEKEYIYLHNTEYINIENQIQEKIKSKSYKTSSSELKIINKDSSNKTNIYILLILLILIISLSIINIINIFKKNVD